MSIAITFHNNIQNKADTAIVTVRHDKTMSSSAEKLNDSLNGFISYHLKAQSKFKGSSGQTCLLTLPEGHDFNKAILLGTGKEEEHDIEALETIGGKLYKALEAADTKKAVFLCSGKAELGSGDLSSEEKAAHIAAGIALRDYKYDQYKKSKTDNNDGDEKPALTGIQFVLDNAKQAAKAYKTLHSAVLGVHWARDLVNAPPNDLYPDSFAKQIKDELKPLGIEIEIFDEKKMQKLGFHAALAVGMGSSRQPRIVVMKWIGHKDKKKAPVGFVGKGVTFDTGGINLKPSTGIADMKLDMGGAAAVVGAMKALALRKAKANVIGIVGLAENMPSERAYRPGDIINSYSGQTIEVLNTDAEGRLVLADCLSYIQDEYNPEIIVDLATLTGAMMVALGYRYCGTFTNNDDLWDHLDQSGQQGNEKLWRMPLDETYAKEMDSTIADIKNIGSNARYAGACTAAAFLERFVKEEQKWAHMDVAGVAWINADNATCPKPATGFGVRTLDKLVTHYEG